MKNIKFCGDCSPSLRSSKYNDFTGNVCMKLQKTLKGLDIATTQVSAPLVVFYSQARHRCEIRDHPRVMINRSFPKCLSFQREKITIESSGKLQTRSVDYFNQLQESSFEDGIVRS